MPRLETPSETVRFGAFELNLRARELRRNGILVKLSGQPFEILALLLERPGDVVTRKELQERLWPADTFVDFEHGMNNAIKKLRTALGDDAEHPRYVETLARVGYRFIAPAERVSSVEYRRAGEAPGGHATQPADRSSAEGSTVPPGENAATERRHGWPVRRLGLGVAVASAVLLQLLRDLESIVRAWRGRRWGSRVRWWLPIS
jgi:DNA-binding winged helix-turn-helix (wHTH) protein